MSEQEEIEQLRKRINELEETQKSHEKKLKDINNNIAILIFVVFGAFALYLSSWNIILAIGIFIAGFLLAIILAPEYRKKKK